MAELNTPLTDPVKPDLDSPTPSRELAGNHADDDAYAIDEYFEPAEQSPIDYGQVPITAAETLAQPTRIITRTFLLTADGTNTVPPLMVLPRDLNRVKLYVVCTTTAGFQIGSELADVYGSPVMAGNEGTFPLDLCGHTGALYVYSPTTDAAKPLLVKVWAVTS